MMTKQEKIKEIAKIICKESKGNICLFDKNLCDCKCSWAKDAEAIYNTVEKNVVKEFAEKLKNVIHERDYVQGYAEIGSIEEIDELLKEYEK